MSCFHLKKISTGRKIQDPSIVFVMCRNVYSWNVSNISLEKNAHFFLTGCKWTNWIIPIVVITSHQPFGLLENFIFEVDKISQLAFHLEQRETTCDMYTWDELVTSHQNSDIGNQFNHHDLPFCHFCPLLLFLLYKKDYRFVSWE